MPSDDGLKLSAVEGAGFDKLEQASFVLGAAGLKRNGGQMFCGKYAGGDARDVFVSRLGERFLDQRTGGRKELHRPSGKHDVFALHFAAPRLEVIKDTLWADEQTASFRPESNEDVQVERGNRLKIE